MDPLVWREAAMRVWGTVVLVLGAILFAVKLSTASLSQLAGQAMMPVLTENSLMGQASRGNDEAMQLLQEIGAIDIENVALMPGELERLRQGSDYSPEVLDLFESDIERMQSLAVEIEATNRLRLPQNLLLIVILGAAFVVFATRRVVPGLIVATVAGVANLATLVWAQAGTLALLFGLAVPIGAAIAYVGYRREQRAKAQLPKGYDVFD
ncbi:MAG: hypothetical protein R3F55_06335 [Alphaproteobacteria bacterium]